MANPPCGGCLWDAALRAAGELELAPTEPVAALSESVAALSEPVATLSGLVATLSGLVAALPSAGRGPLGKMANPPCGGCLWDAAFGGGRAGARPYGTSWRASVGPVFRPGWFGSNWFRRGDLQVARPAKPGFKNAREVTHSKQVMFRAHHCIIAPWDSLNAKTYGSRTGITPQPRTITSHSAPMKRKRRWEGSYAPKIPMTGQ